MKIIRVLSLYLFLSIICLFFCGCRKKDTEDRQINFINHYSVTVLHYGEKIEYKKAFKYSSIESLSSVSKTSTEYNFLILNIKRSDINDTLLEQINAAIHDDDFIVIYLNFNEYYDLIFNSEFDIYGNIDLLSYYGGTIFSVNYTVNIFGESDAIPDHSDSIVYEVYSNIRDTEGIS